MHFRKVLLAIRTSPQEETFDGRIGPSAHANRYDVADIQFGAIMLYIARGTIMMDGVKVSRVHNEGKVYHKEMPFDSAELL